MLYIFNPSCPILLGRQQEKREKRIESEREREKKTLGICE